jgi:hypothetical protein
MKPREWTSIRHFSPEEFNQPEKMSKELVQTLDTIRELAGVPLRVTSSYREGDPNAHGDGTAVDIRVRSSEDRYRVLRAIFIMGIRRVGIYNAHIHIDVSKRLPQDVAWWGKSK